VPASNIIRETINKMDIRCHQQLKDFNERICTKVKELFTKDNNDIKDFCGIWTDEEDSPYNKYFNLAKEEIESTCSKVLKLGEINHHLLEECEHFELCCRYCNDYKGFRSDILEHYKVCLKNPEVKIDCPQCTESVFAVKLEEHKAKDCPEEFLLEQQ